MPSHWATSGGDTLGTSGTITLNNGTVFSIGDIPGNGFNANRLGKINQFAQTFIDERTDWSTMDVDDPDRIHAEVGDDAWFLATYGGQVFIDGTDIVTRLTTVEIYKDTENNDWLTIKFIRVR
jgi:hypothetical protein